MKKIILTLFLSFALICFFCYLIYIQTEKKQKIITILGDNLANLPLDNNYQVINLTNKNLYLIDLEIALTYNKPINNISVHESLNETDILIISIGMNDLYHKISNNSKEIYDYLNNMLNSYEKIISIINHYHLKKVYVLGYYNINNDKEDLFTYLNFKLKKIVNKYHYTYINTNELVGNNPYFLEKKDNFILNKQGYYQIYNFIVENLENY